MKKDHPSVPVTIDEIVETAKACFNVGAGGIHFHLRDENGQHILNSDMCLKALEKLQNNVPNMHLQVTTEAVGRYSPDAMRKLAYEVSPPGISIGIKEMMPSRIPTEKDTELYKSLTNSGTKIQHICYDPKDVDLLSNLLSLANISKEDTWCMLVIGHYSGIPSNPKNISPFLDKLENMKLMLIGQYVLLQKKNYHVLKLQLNWVEKLELVLKILF